jgi:hypothetical protein
MPLLAHHPLLPAYDLSSLDGSPLPAHHPLGQHGHWELGIWRGRDVDLEAKPRVSK